MKAGPEGPDIVENEILPPGPLVADLRVDHEDRKVGNERQSERLRIVVRKRLVGFKRARYACDNPKIEHLLHRLGGHIGQKRPESVIRALEGYVDVFLLVLVERPHRERRGILLRGAIEGDQIAQLVAADRGYLETQGRVVCYHVAVGAHIDAGLDAV